MIDFVNLGYDHFVSGKKIMAILPFGKWSTYSLYKKSKEEGRNTLCNKGRKMRSLVVMDDHSTYASAFTPRTLVHRNETKLSVLDDAEYNFQEANINGDE